MYTLGNWPLPDNKFANKVFRTKYTWNMAVIRALDNATKQMRLAETIMNNIETYGYDHEKVSRLILQYQPEKAKRYCIWCGEQIALFTNSSWCGEHEHLAPAYWHEMEKIRQGKTPNLIKSGGMLIAPPKNMSRSRNRRKDISAKRERVIRKLSPRD